MHRIAHSDFGGGSLAERFSQIIHATPYGMGTGSESDPCVMQPLGAVSTPI
jgi:hypothetical protein